MSCSFCYIHNHINSTDISFIVAKPYIDWLLANGLLMVTLTGGECTLNSDFLQIYTYLKEHGVLVKVFTNGINLSEEVLEVFKQYNPFRVEVSLYAKFQDDNRAYNNILKLKEENIEVLAKTPVTSENYKDFKDIEQWCLNHKIPFKYDTEILDAYDGTINKKYNLPEKIKAELNRKKFEDYSGQQKRKGGIKCFECNGGSFSILIDSMFTLRICGKIGRQFQLYGRTMEVAYKELTDFVNTHKGKKIKGCDNCRALNICKMCYAYSIQKERSGETEFFINDTFCKQTLEYYDYLFPNNIDREN